MLRDGRFYRFGSRAGLRPVHVYVGRIDDPADLNNLVLEPVVTTLVTSMRPEMPRLAVAPFLMSAMLMDPFESIGPFALDEFNFDESYLQWRAAFMAGDAPPWDIGPAQVYNKALRDMLAAHGKKQ